LYYPDPSRDPGRNARPRKAILVGLAHGGTPEHVAEEHLDELAALATSAGVAPAGRVLQRRPAPHPATFIGRGKAEEAGRAAAELGADLLLFDDDLSASQVKNLEKAAEVQVMDRSSLILELFSQRARTGEARTQVELARLEYLLPRLTRMWRHLSRQVGGIGVRGGTGETQLETDRRILRQRIARLKRELSRIERTRGVQRRGRRDAITVALAGYTNAGKSTLFNRLTGAGARAEDRLFATLDSKLRRGAVAPGRVLVFADTVGFIRKLPHHLVSSFRSTLGEIAEADLVLHVIDRSHPQWPEQMAVAAGVLADLGVDRERVIPVLNKIDRLPEGEVGHGGPEGAVWVSAETGEGLDELRAELARRAAWLERGNKAVWRGVEGAGTEAVEVDATPETAGVEAVRAR
jgi:GTP-binding protein HflX